MIDQKHALPMVRQAKLLDMSRSSLYYRPQPTSESDLRLMRRITAHVVLTPERLSFELRPSASAALLQQCAVEPAPTTRRSRCAPSDYYR